MLRRVVLLVIVFLCAACTLRAQDSIRVIIPLAFTSCLTDSLVYTYVREEVIGSDSLQEILTHEARHRTQARTLGCAEMGRRFHVKVEAMALEVDAYCASLPEAIKRGVPRDRALEVYARRIKNQFSLSDSLMALFLLRSICP